MSPSNNHSSALFPSTCEENFSTRSPNSSAPIDRRSMNLSQAQPLADVYFYRPRQSLQARNTTGAQRPVQASRVINRRLLDTIDDALRFLDNQPNPTSRTSTHASEEMKQ